MRTPGILGAYRRPDPGRDYRRGGLRFRHPPFPAGKVKDHISSYAHGQWTYSRRLLLTLNRARLTNAMMKIIVLIFLVAVSINKAKRGRFHSTPIPGVRIC